MAWTAAHRESLKNVKTYSSILVEGDEEAAILVVVKNFNLPNEALDLNLIEVALLKHITYFNSPEAAEDKGPSYCLYGDHLVVIPPVSHWAAWCARGELARTTDNHRTIVGSAPDERGKPLCSLQEYLNESDSLTIDPQGDTVRDVLHDGICAQGCVDGFWPCSRISNVSGDFTQRYRQQMNRKLCAYCMGTAMEDEDEEFLNDWHDGRRQNINELVERYHKLNVRREQLGYEPLQLYESNWGVHFDDDDSAGEGADDYLDPLGSDYDAAADYPQQCTPAETIAALQTMVFGSLDRGAEELGCVICQEAFLEQDLIMLLACGHFFHQECVEAWLRGAVACPTCRGEVVASDDEKAMEEGHETGEEMEVQDQKEDEHEEHEHEENEHSEDEEMEVEDEMEGEEEGEADATLGCREQQKQIAGLDVHAAVLE